MKHNSMRWFRAVMAVIAVVCLAFGSRTVTYVKSADNDTTKSKVVKLDEKLGVKPGAVLAELEAHEHDKYYLGTPYDSTLLTPENCMRPNGEYGGKGGMNCTGFVAYVLKKCGADLSGIAARGYKGGEVNASNWYHWLTENSVEYYHYDTVEKLLAGGKAQKGDVIYFEPISWESEDADCHIGFFWGNQSGENRFWNSSAKPDNGNQISKLISKSPSTVYLFKITRTGEVEVRKASESDGITKGNKCYSLKGAEYTLYRKGTSEAAAIIRTDENGYGKAAGIEEGSYEIVETKAPEGYVLDGEKRKVTVLAGETMVYECKDKPVYSLVDILLEKVDAGTGKKIPQGGAVLSGAEFTVRYYDVISESDPAASGNRPIRTWVFGTDENGEIRFTKEYQIGGDALYSVNGKGVIPVGTVTIQETKAPKGYCLQEQIYVKCIKEETTEQPEGQQVYQQIQVAEKVVRGDLELVKAANGTLQRMSGIPFRITSKTTGESHVIVTDKNGYASTSSEWNLHTQNTNAGGTGEDGVWFGGEEPDDSAGALIYDTYTVEELECENNNDRILIPAFEVEISRDKHVVNLGTLTNDARPLPEIATTARDGETGEQQAAAKENAVIVDEVFYRNLEKGKEYILQGVLMDAAAGEKLQINGEEVTAIRSFTAEKEEGSIEMVFSFDASGLKGKTIVVFEEMFCEEKLVAAHADLSDKGQTIEFPDMSIHTEAKDKDSQTHTGESRKEAVIVDQVVWKNLIPGREYTIRGILMEALSGETLIQDDRAITAEKTFIAEQSDGSIELEFHLDASRLNGKSVVVFERLYLDETEVAVHADPSDEGQTVSYEKKTPVNPGPKASEVLSVKTGDDANLIVLILCVILSCAMILRCVRMSAEQKR